MQQIIHSSLHSLQQLKVFLLQIDKESYTKSVKIFSQSTLGMHTRHIIEFYQCLLNGEHQDVVNYDLRKRDLALETNVAYTLETLEDLMLSLANLKNNYVFSMQVLLEDENNITRVQTNLERELLYLLEHTIHHMAILKMGCIVSFPNVEMDPDFGIAYSTLNYQKRVHRNLLAG